MPKTVNLLEKAAWIYSWLSVRVYRVFWSCLIVSHICALWIEIHQTHAQKEIVVRLFRRIAYIYR